MKKAFAGILSCMLVLTALAVPIPTSAAAVVYSADISWGSFEFSYYEASSGVWDPDTLSYQGATEAGFAPDEEGADLIKVTNYSEMAINTRFSYRSDNDFIDTISGAFEGTGITNGNASLAPAIGLEDKPSVTAKLVLTGTPSSEQLSGQTTIGTVTVSISPQ